MKGSSSQCKESENTKHLSVPLASPITHSPTPFYVIHRMLTGWFERVDEACLKRPIKIYRISTGTVALNKESHNLPLPLEVAFLSSADAKGSLSTNKRSLIHFNARSVHKNIDAMNNFIASLLHAFTFICISETWITDADNNMNGFTSYQAEYCHCQTDNHGGTCSHSQFSGCHLHT